MKLVYFFAYGQWWSVDSKYKYMATDRNGDVFIYKDRPMSYPEAGEWYTPLSCFEGFFHVEIPIDTSLTTPCPDWAQSLVRLK